MVCIIRKKAYDRGGGCSICIKRDDNTISYGSIPDSGKFKEVQNKAHLISY
ncbi:hypothetical protein KL86DYS1_30937 [uncultured Dysgonomonas sp.]|uniref:Uncharacterized protein n=1 Tax=uncultured Dysgonomonas sp. TaxID=206096 RepID=A0A212JZ60_9BACT|nr:hypothetical protein KL86DYS1_30937 [uncultured Dysgonomonas sp.]